MNIKKWNALAAALGLHVILSIMSVFVLHDAKKVA